MTIYDAINKYDCDDWWTNLMNLRKCAAINDYKTAAAERDTYINAYNSAKAGYNENVEEYNSNAELYNNARERGEVSISSKTKNYTSVSEYNGTNAVTRANEAYNEAQTAIDNAQANIDDVQKELSTSYYQYSNFIQSYKGVAGQYNINESLNSDNFSETVEQVNAALNTVNTAIDEAEARKAELDTVIPAKEKEISTKEEEISAKEEEISAKETAKTDAENDLAKANEDLNGLNYSIATKLLPARDNAYKAYEAALGENGITQTEAIVNAITCGVRKLALDAAKVANELATKTYDAYEKVYVEYEDYYNNLIERYESYKENYDAFMRLKASDPDNLLSPGSIFSTLDEKKLFADNAEIKLSITAYNMGVVINGQDLTTRSDSYVKGVVTKNLSEVLDGNTVVETPDIQFDEKTYESGIGEQVQLSDYDYWSAIPSEKLNGIRNLGAEVIYKPELLIKETAFFGLITTSSEKKVEDNVYYSNYVKENKSGLTNNVFTIDYDGLVQKSTNKEVNVYTPILASANLKSQSDIVDQSTSNVTNSDVQTIQLSVPFVITFGNTDSSKNIAYTVGSADLDTKMFCKAYYVKFDFDVHKVQYYKGATGSDMVDYAKGEKVPAGTWIGPITRRTSGNTTLKATVYNKITDASIDIARNETGSYVVRAVAHNATTSMMTTSKKYLDILEVMKVRNDLRDIVTNICTNTTTIGGTQNIPSYFVDRKYNVYVLNRVYDFRITDVKDVNWKSVFRKTTGSTVNAHTGNSYYSGIRKWVFSNDNSNKILARTSSEIGKVPLRTLPLAPYKNTDTLYTKAPKLGYGFSFDLKVTGEYYNSDGSVKEGKKVSIGTRFYYISNNGTNFLEEYNGTGKGIYLFYKNSSGKYIKIGNDGGKYQLTFVPNDGYRLLSSNETLTLSKKTVGLGNLRNITLTHEMATVSQTYTTQLATNNGSVITYYGEYSLPSSTIAVAVDEHGKYNINKPLKDGYIGVIFDIAVAVDSDTKNNAISLSYSKNTNGTNTSQWDYEGYLGITKPGNTYSTSLQLESGKWSITNAVYNKIKGTVILYDIDERASDDYQ